MEGCLSRRGKNISVYIFFFFFKFKLHNHTFKKNNNSLTVQILYNLQNLATFHSEERLVNSERGRESFGFLSILLVNGVNSLQWR